MHMADALVSPLVAGTLYACSAVAAGYSIKKVEATDLTHKIPLMGVMGAFVFATQMINFTIPGTGSSGHLCGGMLLSAILGPYAGFLTMTTVLTIQCLLFADGGLLALGCNVWNMGFYGCFVGGYLVWNLFMRRGVSRGRIVAASVIGAVVSLLMGAFSVTLETLASGITELPFSVFLGFMLPIHLVIGLVEGLITAAVLLFVYEARPQLLVDHFEETDADNRWSVTAVVVVLAAVTLVIGGLFSLYASSNPDGLEWSMLQTAGVTELETGGSIYQWVGELQESTALLPDYSFKGTESATGTSFSGIVGALVVLACCIVGSLLLKRKVNESRR